ncbi:hypothetical protein [Enterobacter soli]|uniref:hypothetical protein n=1 Tax=Enterobacter soli TaxID=885040 RepID=UPI0034CE89FF
MKNEYSLNFLEKQRLPSSEKEESVYFKMLHVIETGKIKHSFNSLDELYNKLSLNDYYIAHNLIIRKGNKKIFKGRVFISKRDKLISFLNKSRAINDIRSYLISPAINNEFDYVCYVDDDQIHLYCI